MPTPRYLYHMPQFSISKGITYPDVLFTVRSPLKIIDLLYGKVSSISPACLLLRVALGILLIKHKHPLYDKSNHKLDHFYALSRIRVIAAYLLTVFKAVQFSVSPLVTLVNSALNRFPLFTRLNKIHPIYYQKVSSYFHLTNISYSIDHVYK